MRPSKGKAAAAAGAAVVVSLAGGAGIAAAVSGPPPSAPTSTTADERREAGEQNPSYTGSVRAPGGDARDDQGRDDERAEAASLARLAKVSAAEAQASALRAVPGSVGTVELDNENGFVVYSVEITTSAGKSVDVKVDAGTAQVLARDAGEDSAEDSGETSAEEAGEDSAEEAAPTTG